ncbi:MAG: hypothetical protein WC333_02005 [Dehalococcoidia bacterium]|jgi:hypothetical protein
MNEINKIPSEYIEPYLVKFLGSMIDFLACAYLTEEDKQNIGRGIGWTVAEVKLWIKGVEVFVSQSCGIHASIAMSNQLEKFICMPDKELKEMCAKVAREAVREWDE